MSHKKNIFEHTVYAPFTGLLPKGRIKVNGRKDSEKDYKPLEADFGPLAAKKPDPLKDEPIRPLEVCRRPKPKPLTEAEKKKILEDSYSPPTDNSLPSYLTLRISGKKQMESDKHLIK